MGDAGKNANNAKHDVMLVQLMLHVIKNDKKKEYLTQGHNGIYGPDLVEAITSFQDDHRNDKTIPAGVVQDKEGVIAPGGDTFMKLTTRLPDTLKRARTTAGVSFVYLDMGAGALQTSVGTLTNAKNNLIGHFPTNLIKLVSAFYARK